MSDLWNFDDLIQRCDNCDKNLLLGNGFSIAYDEDKFSYKNLFDKSQIPENTKNVFKKFQTYDFELIIKKLEDAANLLKAYNKRLVLPQKLKDEAANLREELIYCILDTHPKSQNDIEKTKIFNTLKFLSNFHNIFTVNYDCLLYWVLLNKKDYEKLYNKNANNIFDMKDGFSKNSGKLIWGTEKAKNQNVFYLHGALHLFENYINYNIKTLKIQRAQYYLLDRIKENITQGLYPLIVTEGKSQYKYNKIVSKNYLNYCYTYLYNIKNILFIHGHSLDKKDKHIFEAINDNKNIKKIYISVHQQKENLKDKRKKSDTFFATREKEGTLKVEFYDAESVNIW